MQLVAVASSLLSLAACGQLAVEDPHADAGTRMWNVASRLEHDRRTGGMAGAIDDIGHCYASASGPILKIWALRDCMVLDYAAYQVDVTIGRRIFRQSLPYFEDQAFASRVNRYAKLDGFTSAAQLANYLRDTYAVVRIDLAQLNAAPVVARPRSRPAKPPARGSGTSGLEPQKQPTLP